MESNYQPARTSPSLNTAAKPLRAAVVVPPIQDFYFSPHRFSTIGASILSDLLKRVGLEVTFVNFPAMVKKGCTMSLPSELSYLKPYILEDETGKASFFKTFKRFGPSLQQCSEMICVLKPDLCFYSCFAFCYATPALQLSKLVKQQCLRAVSVFGGAGVSTYPEYFLRDESVDYTISGEAEVSICDFINYITTPYPEPNKVSGLGWKENGNFRYSPVRLTESEEILCPAMKTGESRAMAYYTVSLSRGCPLECNFCSNWLCHGKNFRRCTDQQIEKIIDEISKSDISSKKTISINFEDDNLLFDYPFWVKTIKSIRNQFPDTQFYAENGIDYRLLNDQKCRELISLGFAQFNFSLGSVNKSVLKTAGRKTDLEHYSAMLSIASQYSLPVITYFICGFKDDSIESIAQNLAFLFKQKTLIGISLFYAVPGICGFEDRSMFDRLAPVLCCGSSAYPWNNSLSTETLISAFRLARIINLSKSQIISSDEKLLLDEIFKTKKLFTILKKKSEISIVEVPNQDHQLVRMVLEMAR